MKKLILILGMFIALSVAAMAQGDIGTLQTFKAGLIAEDSARIEGFIRVADSIISEGTAIFEDNLVLSSGDTLNYIKVTDTDTVICINGVEIPFGASVLGAVDHNAIINTHDLTTDIDHDAIANFAENEHRIWEITGAEDIHDDRIAESSVTQHEGAIDHDQLTNFEAGEHVAIAGGSGMTLDGTDMDLGGALDAPESITGTEVNSLSINISDADDRSVKLVIDGAFSVKVYSEDDYTEDSAVVVIDSNLILMAVYNAGAIKGILIDTSTTSGVVLYDHVTGQGLRFGDDYSPGYGLRSATDKAYQDLHLGSQDLNSTIYDPGPDEHDGIMVWDSLLNQYVSKPSIPVSQAAGIVLCKVDTILYSNTTVDTVITLPVGAIIWDIQVFIETSFDGSGTNLLDVGIIGDTDRYENDLDVSVPDPKWYGLANLSDIMLATTDIIWRYFDSATSATEGEAYIYVIYSIQPN